MSAELEAEQLRNDLLELHYMLDSRDAEISRLCALVKEAFHEAAGWTGGVYPSWQESAALAALKSSHNMPKTP